MGSFSIWHWLIVLVIFGGIGWLVFSSRNKVATATGEPAGFGGWLILPMIGQTVAPIKTLAGVAETAKAYDQYGSVPGAQVASYGEGALTFAYLALQVVTLIAMYRKSRLFPKLFLYQWLAIPVYLTLDALVVSLSLGVSVDQLYGQAEIAAAVTPFVAAGLWVLYMFKSVRVRNTFVRGRSFGDVVVEPR
ncbi:DUF2569 family protein [Rhizobium sp. P32RR-XVIII]|uniref:DUF2569 family protein n=1 Tax=Rhizobium sp. P32RR-XVIII TaxID=2726738 RepID=UPI0014567302|nr:DUF2569 domain-containing protein [Rhizobium sp. P32RR-XVIII]NLS01994.1 DUF2569 family protein [Rhizobium sp. P32RR-XVIII]